MTTPLVSIVIRSKNEERWIRSCLASVFAQNFKNFEVILVDNESTDLTCARAKQFPIAQLSTIREFRPGKAINQGISLARGEYIVLLSAHCIPTSPYWLENLLAGFGDDPEGKIAGVYGRQEPLPFTDDLDKRDLVITFGLDRRVQVKDSFFHNANSIVRKSVLDRIPFNAEVSNIEDRVWGREVIDAGYKLAYEPTASVFHYHGIHQGANRRRAKNIVQIIESLEGESLSFERSYSLLNYSAAAIILARGAPEPFCGRTLLEFAIESARKSKHIRDVYVATENADTKALAERAGAKVPFLRPDELSTPEVGVEQVLQYFVRRLENIEPSPDLFVYLSTKHPFRRDGILDHLIELLVSRGFDSVMAGSATFKSCWTQEEEGLRRLDEGFVARGQKKPIHIAYAGLGCVTYPEFLRKGVLLGEKVGILEMLDHYATMEVRTHQEIQLAEHVYPQWLKFMRGEFGAQGPLGHVSMEGMTERPSLQ